MRLPICIRVLLTAGLFLAGVIRCGKSQAVGEAPVTGELDLTFTVRSPLSTRTEIARRLSFKEAELGADYDLSKCPFKAYVPKNYESGTPHGVFVFLGYKDAESVATEWEPVLDAAHVIFITPVCHHGDHFPNQVPLWQMMGLGFDAIENLEKQYNVDKRRLYLMTWNEGSMRMSLGSADVFTGLIVTGDRTYCQKMPLSDRKRYFEANFPPAPAALMGEAKHRPIVIIDEDFSQPDRPPQLIVATMKSNGFTNVLTVPLSLGGDLHYPHMKPAWFEKTVLPFMDKAAIAAPVKPAVASSDSPPAVPAPAVPAPTSQRSTEPPATADEPAPAVAPSNPDAQRLLRLSRLYIENGQTALARTNLQLLLKHYPKDPAAPEASSLLAKLPPE